MLAELVGSSGTTTLAGSFGTCKGGLACLASLTVDAIPGRTVTLSISVPALGGHLVKEYVNISLIECPPGWFEEITRQQNVVCTPCKEGEFEQNGA